MMTDMRERGWVNARFLSESGAVATQLPSGHRHERLTFSPGADGTEFGGDLGPNMTVSYSLNARNGQFLVFQLMGDPSLRYRIFNPDKTELLGWVPAGQVYRGQLWQSGDHVIEVENRSSRLEYFSAVVGIQR